MLPSKGYFSPLPCPFFDSGVCDRPHCHFRHSKKDKSTENEENQGAKTKSANIAEKNVNIKELVTETLKKVLSHTEIREKAEAENVDTDAIVSEVVKTLKPISTPQIESPKQETESKEIPSYKPTPIAELKRRHIPVVHAPTKPLAFDRFKRKDVYTPRSVRPNVNTSYVPTSSGDQNDAYLPEGPDNAYTYQPSEIFLNKKSDETDQEATLVTTQEFLDNQEATLKALDKLIDEEFDTSHEIVLEEKLPKTDKTPQNDDTNKEEPTKHQEAIKKHSSDSTRKYKSSSSSSRRSSSKKPYDKDKDRKPSSSRHNDDKSIVKTSVTDNIKVKYGENSSKSQKDSSTDRHKKESSHSDEKSSGRTSETDKTKVKDGENSSKSRKDTSTDRHKKESPHDDDKNSIKTSEVDKTKVKDGDNSSKSKKDSSSERLKKESSSHKKKKERSSSDKHTKNGSSEKLKVISSDKHKKENSSEKLPKSNSSEQHKLSTSEKYKDEDPGKPKENSSEKHRENSIEQQKENHSETPKQNSADKHQKESSSDKPKKYSSEKQQKGSSSDKHKSKSSSDSHKKHTSSNSHKKDSSSDSQKKYFDKKKKEDSHGSSHKTLSKRGDHHKHARTTVHRNPSASLSPASDGEKMEEDVTSVDMENFDPSGSGSEVEEVEDIEEVDEPIVIDSSSNSCAESSSENFLSNAYQDNSNSASSDGYESPPLKKKKDAIKLPEASAFTERWRKARETVQTKCSGKVRIAHVPNVSSLLTAKVQIIEKSKKVLLEKESLYPTLGDPVCEDYTPKVPQRVARAPPKEVAKYPSVVVDPNLKVPFSIRQPCLHRLYDAYAKHFLHDEAKEKALNEELDICRRLHVNKTYQNAVALAVLRINKIQKEATNDSDKKESNKLKSSSVPEYTHGWTLYQCFAKYFLEEEDLIKNGFPMEIESKPGCGYIEKSARRSKESKQTTAEPFSRVCANCSKNYFVNDEGFPTEEYDCYYHWGKLMRKRSGGGIVELYRCCNGEIGGEPCTNGRYHVSSQYDEDCLEGFVTSRPLRHGESKHKAGIFAMDCEMCYTTKGLDLTRVTLVDLNGTVVYDKVVVPEGPILDYCTRFSGMTEEMVAASNLKLKDIQRHLLKFINEKTILIGHSLENDFKALRLFHKTVVDTSAVFPHRLGLPHKLALRQIAKDILNITIQEKESGHDSFEDANTCMQIMLFKIKEDAKSRKPRIIISLDKKKAPR